MPGPGLRKEKPPTHQEKLRFHPAKPFFQPKPRVFHPEYWQRCMSKPSFHPKNRKTHTAKRLYKLESPQTLAKKGIDIPAQNPAFHRPQQSGHPTMNDSQSQRAGRHTSHTGSGPGTELFRARMYFFPGEVLPPKSAPCFITLESPGFSFSRVQCSPVCL